MTQPKKRTVTHVEFILHVDMPIRLADTIQNVLEAFADNLMKSSLAVKLARIERSEHDGHSHYVGRRKLL